jgi:hypothetical protein
MARAQDFLDALVALGLLDRDGDGHYANQSDAAPDLDSRKATYMLAEARTPQCAALRR